MRPARDDMRWRRHRRLDRLFLELPRGPVDRHRTDKAGLRGVRQGVTLASVAIVHYSGGTRALSRCASWPLARRRRGKMATLDKLIQEIDSRYRLGSKACRLVQETLGLITGQPGGIGDFLNTFKAAGFAAEVASWLGGTGTVPLSGQEVEQTLGCDGVSEIANKVGVSQRFAKTILGYAIPRTIGLLATGGAIPSAIPVTASSFLDSANHSNFCRSRARASLRDQPLALPAWDQQEETEQSDSRTDRGRAIDTRVQSELVSSIVPRGTSLRWIVVLSLPVWRSSLRLSAPFPLSSGTRFHHSTCDA